jgi:hypothetical protein
LPHNATDRRVGWRLSDPGGAVGFVTAEDSVYSFKALTADTVRIYAFPVASGSFEETAIKDSCTVIIVGQFVFVDTIAANGIIEMSLKMPEDEVITGSFRLELPRGFGLSCMPSDRNNYKTSLEADYGRSSELNIVRNNDSTYIFDVKLRPVVSSGSMLRSVSKRKIMSIAYTVYGDFAGNRTALYDARFLDVKFRLKNSVELKDERLELRIKVFEDPTGNEFVQERERVFAYMSDNRLHVVTDMAETVYVYLLNGSTIMAKEKAEGEAVFEMDVQEKILIVKGSSGWSRKVFVR